MGKNGEKYEYIVFLQPKCKVAYIYNDDTIRQGLQKMNYYGYSAIPVLDENEHYVGTITGR